MRFFRPPRIEQGICAATCFIVAYEMHIKEANGLVEVVFKKTQTTNVRQVKHLI